MSFSVGDIYDDYLESLQNLPSEIDQNMHELRRMDDDLQKYKEDYIRNRRAYVKLYRLNHTHDNASRLCIEKDFKTAMQKQDQKIELAMRMYDLVSRHIERLDLQVAKSDIHESDWIHHQQKKLDRKRGPYPPHESPPRKRIHISRPTTQTNQFDLRDINEPTYCYCKQVSFGDMIACDGDNCEREWFHYACVGLVEPPAGKWFCEDCRAEQIVSEDDVY
ncbi:Inhibitor of growth protein 4 [Choanephora cucurbitarum]|uniref:Chromatin modification-related protein n=1 Tax=Choanephora cucurbitarum TaxID=101091 RepID=A0A1C7N1X6_9FUNG|nr:Inhibitor of growth protein 4 [Choanephora cucurbitarum]